MEGIVGTLFILVVIAYFLMKGSGSTSKTKTTIKLNLEPPTTKIHPNPPAPSSKTSTSTNTNPSPVNKPPFSTTGEFKTSTEGFIPTDKCECGGQWVKHVNKTTGDDFLDVRAIQPVKIPGINNK